MKKYVIMFIILFLCLGCTNTKVEDDPTDIVDNPTDVDEEPIKNPYEPPYSTLDEYKNIDYFCPDYLYFDSSEFESFDRIAISIRTDNDSHGKSLIIGVYETGGILYVGDYELVENDLFEGTLYSFSGSFDSSTLPDEYTKDVTFPLQTDDVDGYFVLSDDFKTLYFLTDEEQLTTGDYSNAIICTILYYEWFIIMIILIVL